MLSESEIGTLQAVVHLMRSQGVPPTMLVEGAMRGFSPTPLPPELANLRARVHVLEHRLEEAVRRIAALSAKPSHETEPQIAGISDIQAELADLREQVNSFNPTYGAFS